MSDNVKIISEFNKFVNSYCSASRDVYDIKLINIIKKNFNDIASCGVALGKRAKLLSNLIQTEDATIPSSIESDEHETELQGFNITSLQKITLSTFRGFRNEKQIDLDKQYTFIYGPNGSGKSCFCEALEYSMLGYINEAQEKKIPESSYITNIHEKASSPPILIAKDLEGKEINVTPNPRMFEFCFIEKNRIDKFARYSSNTPKNQSLILSSLFGLEEFNDFVSDFTDNFDQKLDLTGVKKQALEEKQKTVFADYQTVEERNKELLALLKEECNLIKQLEDKVSTGKIADVIKNKKEKIVLYNNKNQIFNVNTRVKNSLSLMTDKLSELTDKINVFQDNKEKVRFKDLYNAIQNIQEYSKDKCPSCDTPLDNVVNNPFNKASSGLSELNELAKLENEINELVVELKTEYIKFTTLNSELKENDYFISQNIDLTNFNAKNIEATKLSDYSEVWTNIVNEIQTLSNSFEQLSDKSSSEELDRIEKELEVIDNAKDKITKSKEERNILRSQKIKSRNNIKQFNKENESLIKDVENEKEVVEINIKYSKAYKNVITSLKQYKDMLPSTLSKGLSESAKDIYNYINVESRHDNHEFIKELRLPDGTNNIIELSFDGTNYINALQVLSEGHIRCLGLSLLLAKIIDNKNSIIIFDDVINSIDSEHRTGIKKCIFDYEELRNKQMIITSNSDMFITALEQGILKSEYNTVANRYNFIYESHKDIEYDNEAGFYLIKADEFSNKNKLEDALAQSRKALESTADNIGRIINKDRNVKLKIESSPPKYIPDTYSKIITLNKHLKDNQHELSDITKHFDTLLDLKQSKPIYWKYLNGGSHSSEDREEFDNAIVKTIIDTLTEIDKIYKKPKKPEKDTSNKPENEKSTSKSTSKSRKKNTKNDQMTLF